MKTLVRTLGFLCVLTCTTSAADQPPNVVLIFADDLGYGDLGCYGATKVQTPNIDKLAAEGRRFTDAHSVSAVCTPSRYALLTGQYPVRANGGKGLWGPAPITSPLLVDTEKTTIADVFKDSGYETACFGKWHLGFGKGSNKWQEPLRPGPQDLGFDYYFGMPVVNSAPPYVYVENDRVVGSDPSDPLVHLGRRAKGTTPITPIPPEAAQRSPNQFGGAKKAHELFNDYQVGTTLAKKSVEWIEQRRDKPFFLYLATTNIHHPFTPAKRFQGTSQCGLYGDFIHELDWIVGEIVSCLEGNGLSDNTLVIFTSDNGGMFNLGAQTAFKAGHRQNGDLLGFKFGAWEGGQRVPMIVRWPGKVPAGSTSNQLMGHVDMLATIAALTEQKLDKSQQADSRNMLPAFVGEPETPIRDHLVLAPHKGTHLSIRKGKWMYIPRQGSGGFGGKKPGDHTFAGPPAASFVGSVNSDIENGKIKKDAPPAQLYDLEADVSQTQNVYDKHPDVVKELSTLLASYLPLKQRAASKAKNRTTSKNEGAKTSPPSGKPNATSLKANYSEAKGIGAEKGVMRRDPSDIIRVGDRYYVWYSKGQIAPGYDATVWYATSPDGREWTEQGMALAKGKPGGWDGASVFTPNILVAEGRYWLFYTGTSKEYKKPFIPDSKIGIAVSDSPNGPWERLGTNPAVKNSDNPKEFDSHLIDDACLIVRDGKYWLYFKGRQLRKGPVQTQMGLAIADKPEGPYVKSKNNPVIPGNHEVLVWPQGPGVAALIGTTGPKEITRSILYSQDGRRFLKTHDVDSVPHAGAAYRPEAFTDSGQGKQIQWGVHIGRRKGLLPFIERFDLTRIEQ